MKFVLLVTACLVASVYGEAELNIEDSGKYTFLYSVEDAGAHKRQESSNGDGTVSGSYSYVDPNGDLRKVEYKAGGSIGFQATGDISVDKKTAEKAQEIAALAPKAPVVETAEVKIPASPFTLPLYALPGIHAPAHVLAHPLALPYAYFHHRPLFVL
ncbi:Adult-specific rigid cuticular protein 12.6 like protein [Argiope bruennichi]|uniref:Adult-specific rigid cuticular protein 12.6 like protein n=1 Tax=Argiope bruennichi TaxID=94029 RepID=A0A8T0F4R6_ARGBR|nr:Adult-specific rigid cuticular protein 12.6 like protein [Argiope bruennichi]